MKIGIDISQIIHEGTGVSRYVVNVVKNIVENDLENEYILFGYSLRKKDSLDNFCGQFKSKRITKKIFPIPQSVLEIVWNQIHILPLEYFTGPIDLYHSSDWTEPPAKCRKITTIHDLSILKYPQFFPEKIVNVHRRKLKWVESESALIIADSLSTKTDCLNFLKIPEEKIIVIYPGIDKRFKPQDKMKIETVKLKYKLERPYLLSLGTREPRKNIGNLIHAFYLLNNPNIDLLIAGKIGWGDASINYHKNIKILGFVPDSDLPALYSASSGFIYPSLYEGFGFPVLEAFACGCPVVTSRKGSLPEVGGKYATYINPLSIESISSGIKKVLADPGFVSKSLQSWASHFSWKKTALQTIDLYKKVG